MSRLIDFTGQGWLQLGELTLAFALSALVGLEREIRQKSAGLRTHTLVGVSSALFILISKYGFTDVLRNGVVIVDPSRVAAQIVSGIGFIGGGVIFMRRDVVRGLTTAASVWLTAALGMASGAGLPVLAIATAGGHFVIMLGFPKLLQYVPRKKRNSTRLQIVYLDGSGLLRRILIVCTSLRFTIDHVEIERDGDASAAREEAPDLAEDLTAELAEREHVAGERLDKGLVVIRMQVKGNRPVAHLIARLAEIDGVLRVGSTASQDELE